MTDKTPPSAAGSGANPALDPSNFEALRLSRHDGVLRVQIDNADSDTNAMDRQQHYEIMRLFHELRLEREARAVLLLGSRGVFSAGGPADPNWILGMQNMDQLAPHAIGVRQMIYNLVDLELPIVCAVEGQATASAASIALLCDAIFMAENAEISDPHVLLGLAAGDGGSAIWPLLMGPIMAKRYLLTGDPLTAQDAYRLGVVTSVVPEKDLEPEAMAFAQRLAANPPLAVRYIKQSVNQVIKQAVLNAFDSSLGSIMVTARTQDFVEALSAMIEEREPNFEGR